MKIDYARTRPVKSPKRGDGTIESRSAGYDFFIPEVTPQLLIDIKEKNEKIELSADGIEIGPHERILIPAGIKMNMVKLANEMYLDYGYGIASIAFNKSGVSVKLGLNVMACVIDEDYQGEIHISIQNTTNDPVVIKFGDKIIQFLFIPVLLPALVEKPQEELFNIETVRGAGGFGSTGNN